MYAHIHAHIHARIHTYMHVHNTLNSHCQVERWVSEGRADVNAREADTGRTALHAAAAQVC